MNADRVTSQRALFQYRRDRNKSLRRCINHPLTDRAKPHDAPVDGHVRCAACIAVYDRSR